MKTDVKGCSTCPIGEEQFEVFATSKGPRLQYDYRRPDGSLFSCVGKTMADCRAKRDGTYQPSVITPSRPCSGERLCEPCRMQVLIDTGNEHLFGAEVYAGTRTHA